MKRSSKALLWIVQAMYKEEAQVVAHERDINEEYLDAREKGGPSIVESMERARQVSGGGFGLTGQAPRPEPVSK